MRLDIGDILIYTGGCDSDFTIGKGYEIVDYMNFIIFIIDDYGEDIPYDIFDDCKRYVGKYFCYPNQYRNNKLKTIL